MDIPSEFSHCSEQSRCVAKGFNALTSFSKANKNLWRTDKTMRKSIDWKLGVFGIIALILTLGLAVGDAVAVPSGTITSGARIIAGSDENAIQIRITGATEGGSFTIEPPEGFPPITDDNTDVTGGSVSADGAASQPATISVAADVTELTLLYYNVTAPTEVGRPEFTITEGTDTSPIQVVVTVDGSGDVLVENKRNLVETAGVPGKTFKFVYTAVGTAAENPDSLNRGELQLRIPLGWPTPTSSNIAVNVDPSGVNPTTGRDIPPLPVSVGAFSISGSGPWLITVPITEMGGEQQIGIEYKNIAVPFATGTYNFPVSVRGFGGILTLVQLQATDVFADKTDSVKIEVKVAGRGSGTMTVSGGPVAAGSTGNQLTFVYTAEGTLDGGALELRSRGDTWTDLPQGTRGSVGYTTVTFSSGASGSFHFAEEKGKKAPDFSGKGVGIKFNTMRVGQTVTIVYGAGGGSSGATAPDTTGLSYFDVYVGPDYSSADNIGIGSAEGQGNNAKLLTGAPFVSVQSQAGSGTVQITDDSAGDQTTNAGAKEVLTFTFTADGDMNGGAFSVTLDNSWPSFPTGGNTNVESTGSTDAPIFRQREIIVPIVFLSATQTITVKYGGKEKVSAPEIPETSVFTFKSRSTPSGTFVAITDPSASDADIRDFEVKVTQAADGSGKVTLPEAQRKVTAGSAGNTFNITYKAVGQMDGGKIQLSVPAGSGVTDEAWTALQENLTVQASSGTSLTDRTFDDDRTVTYTITTLRKDGTVTFNYTGVQVQSRIAPRDNINNNPDAKDADGNPTVGSGLTDEDDESGPVPLVVRVTGSKDGDIAADGAVVGDTEANVTVDNAADGSGAATIVFEDLEGSREITVDGKNEDVPANRKVDIEITYAAAGDMSSANNAYTPNENLVGVELTIPAGFPIPQATEADGVGFISMEGGGTLDDTKRPALDLFGRVVKIKNIVLARGEGLRISFKNVTTPDARGTHTFTIRSQGRVATGDPPDRGLKDLIAGSPRVTIGSVISGSGSAKILTPELQELTIDGEKKKVHALIAGKPGATIVFEFKAEGSMDGGEVKLIVPSDWVAPGGEDSLNNSSRKGYTTVTFSSGVRIGSLSFPQVEGGDPSVIIPIVAMGKDDTLRITYGLGGGASGVDIPELDNYVHQFSVQTSTRGESFDDIDAEPESVELQIRSTALAGSGKIVVSPDSVPASVEGVERKTTLNFQYTAAGNISTIGLRTAPGDWPFFKHSTSAETDGRVSTNRGTLTGPTRDSPSGNLTVTFSPELIEGQSVTITYSNVTVPTNAAEHDFDFTSEGAPLGLGPAKVYVVSADGSGKVSRTARETGAVTENAAIGKGNVVIEHGRRAGEKGNLVFHYNLAAEEYVRNGEVRINVPSGWTAPTTGNVEVKQFEGSAEVAEADRPALRIAGRAIVVDIKKQNSAENIQITFKEAVAPTRSSESEFRVLAKSSSRGSLQQIRKNRTVIPRESAVVIVQVVNGPNGSGTATSNIPATVPSGTSHNRFRFDYTATRELSTREPYPTSQPGTDFAGVAGIQLTIPVDWSQPVIPDSSPTVNNSNTAYVTVSGPRDAFFDFGEAGNLEQDLVISGNTASGYTISVPIKRILPGQRITLTYGAGKDTAEAQGNKQDKVAFLIKSKGGQRSSDDGIDSDDTFIALAKGGQLVEGGKYEFNVGPAGDGSGTVTAAVTRNQEDTNAKVYGGDSGITIKFIYTATGQVQKGRLRIVTPTGWTPPQGSPGSAGFTQQDPSETGKIGLPTFSGGGVEFPIPTMSNGQSVNILYGALAVNTPANGAESPDHKSEAGEKAPKFIVTMKSEGGSFERVARSDAVAAEHVFSGIPIEITNARNGTGKATISPSETNAGNTGTYTVTYTANAALHGGAVRLTIPVDWALKAYDKDKSPVGTNGKLEGDPAYDSANRWITANIKELQGGQTVTFTLKETRAQRNKQDNVYLDVATRRDRESGAFELLSGDNRAKVAKVLQAADGSGSMVARDADDSYDINVVRVGETLSGDIKFKFTPAGTMLEDGRIELDIPDGWTAPVKENDKDGGISLQNVSETFDALEHLTDSDPSGRTAVVTIKLVKEGDTVVRLTHEDAFFIVYKNPTAPTEPGVYEFKARSKSHKDGSLTLLSGPKITVSPEGDGAGAMEIDPKDVPATKEGFVLKFTYTAAESMRGGELRVTIPSTWSKAKDNIFNLDGDDGTKNKATFKVPGEVPRQDHTPDVGFDGDHTIVIPIRSRDVRDQIIFKYKGTVQGAAGTVTFETKTKLTNDGTLTSIATPPELTVKNVEKGRGTVTFNTGDPVDQSRVAAASSGNQITFDFKAVGTMNGGAVSMDVPGNWSPPQRTQGVAGYVTVSAPSGGSLGAASVSDNTVTVPINTLAADQIVRIVYGSGSGSSGAVAQDNAGGATFVFKTKGSGGDDFEAIGNHPTVNVTNARDGSGTMTVKRTDAKEGEETTATAGSVSEFVFTYLPAGTINGGKVQLTVPEGWPAPVGTSGQHGFTTAETDPGAALGTLTFDPIARSVTVPISALSVVRDDKGDIVGQKVIIKYGSGGGVNGVPVPAETGDAPFGVKSQGLTNAEGGQLIELLSAAPEVEITSPTDGFGMAIVLGGPYTGGSSGNMVTIIFTANANVTGGSVSVDVPMDWTAPTAGNIAVVSTGTIGDPTFNGQTVTVDGVTLNSGQTITFTYSGATAQGAAGSATFIVKSKGSAEGTLTELVGVSGTKSEWTVTVINAADGSGMLVAEPPFAVAGSTVDIDLVYTAVGTITGGVIRVTIPMDEGWTEPQNFNTNDAGYVAVTASAGNVISTAQVSAGKVTVPITSLAPGGTVTISYRKATAPAAAGVSEFMAQSRGSGAGTSEFLAPATVTLTEAADSLMVVSDTPSVFVEQVVQLTIKLLKDGEPAASAKDETVWLISDSETGLFDTEMDGDFDGTVDSAVIPAGETWINVYYKDITSGEVELTGKIAEFAEEMQMSTTTITISEGATVLAIESDDTLFAGGSIEIAVTLWSADDNASGLGTDLEVMLATSATETGVFKLVGNPVTSVIIPAGEISKTVTYEDTMIGTATLTATAEGLTDGTLEVMVHEILAEVMVDPMMAKAGDEVTVTATAKPGLMPPPSFTVGDIVQTGIAMEESPDGTYTGMFTVIADVHTDGMYDVVVTVGEGDAAVMKTVENGVTIDNTAPMITSGHDAPISAQNGDTVMLMVSSEEAGLTVMGTGVQAVDTMAESDSITFMESADTAGMYKAEFMISADNEADNGMYMISVTAMDAVGNTSAAVSISINLQNGAEFELTVPKDISLIHIPLKVTSVDGENQMLEKISDLYDALGGSDNVSLLITYNSEAVRWDSYLGAVSMGGSANRQITGDLGILAAMKNEVTLMLQGEAWGEDGESMISLSKGTNLVGVPLDSDELDMVSDLLSDNVGTVIVSHEGEFMLVAAPGDSGDGPIEGSRSYIVTANAVATIPVTGEAWSSMPSTGITAAPVAIPHIVAVDGATPVLAIRGSITGESRGIAQVDLRITVRNLSTGASVSVVSGGEGDAGQYDVTFVDTKAARAAQVGDVLEIKAESPNPLIGVQPLRHIVSVDDVKNSRIQLTELVTYEIPAKTELLLNYPNPFNPETWIPFRLAEDSQVSLTIYDRTGRVVRSVDVGHRPAAVYESRAKAIYWDGRNDFGERVASGMYFYTLTAKDFSATRRMVILK